MKDRLEAAPCAYVEFTDAGVITHANQTLGKMLGRPGDHFIGKKFDSLLTLANRIFFQTHFFPLIKLKGFVDEIFLALSRSDGTDVPVVTSAVNKDGLTQCVFLPIKERHKYEAEILQARHKAEEALKDNAELKSAKEEIEAKARFLDNRLHELMARNRELHSLDQILAHDLREPIRKVRFFSDMVNENVTALNEDGVLGLRKIREESERALKLANEVQRYLEAGDLSEKLVSVSLNSVIDRTADRIRKRISDWSLEMGELPQIAGRPRQLETLFEEILGNSIKFRSPTRPLRIVITAKKIQLNTYHETQNRYVYRDFVQLDISDNGQGFDPGYASYMFELFKKVDLASEGMGVGLAICRKIVLAHYGSMEITGSLGQGAICVIRLPVDA